MHSKRVKTNCSKKVYVHEYGYIPEILKQAHVGKVNNVLYVTVDKGVQLVAKKNYHWLISYNECENVLISHIDDDGGCRKKYHKIMKRLNYDCWALRNENDEPKLILSSYHLKVKSEYIER